MYQKICTKRCKTNLCINEKRSDQKVSQWKSAAENIGRHKSARRKPVVEPVCFLCAGVVFMTLKPISNNVSATDFAIWPILCD